MKLKKIISYLPGFVFYFRHILSVGCRDTWEFNNTMEYEVGASYDIFLTGEDVGIAGALFTYYTLYNISQWLCMK